jgi:hypothetical protein
LDGHGPQHDGVDQAEDRGVGADSQSQREDGDGEETGAAAQRSQRIAQVLRQIGEPAQAADVAAFFLDLLDAAEFEAGAAFGFDRVHALGDVIPS